MADIGKSLDVGVDAGYSLVMGGKATLSENVAYSIGDACLQSCGRDPTAGLALSQKALVKLDERRVSYKFL